MKHVCNAPRLTQLSWVLIVLVFACGCPAGSSKSNRATSEFDGEYPIQATVTVGMVADIVRAIGGEHVEVKQLMQAGVDPHLYTPTRDDSAAILGADIVFYNGLLLEGKMSEMLERTSSSRRVFAAAETLAPEILTTDPEQENHPDPHVWMSVELWRQVAEGVRDELCKFDPDHCEDYEAAAKELNAKFASLHAYGKRVIASIPESKRVLVTSHDAFRYFGAAYGVEVQAVQGISTDSEAGLRRINELVDMLVERKVESVFVESSVPKESIESLLRGAETKGQKVDIGGSLFSDAMGNVGTYEGTYVGMMDHNLTTIAKSLGGVDVPEAGFKSLADSPAGSSGADQSVVE